MKTKPPPTPLPYEIEENIPVQMGTRGSNFQTFLDGIKNTMGKLEPTQSFFIPANAYSLESSIRGGVNTAKKWMMEEWRGTEYRSKAILDAAGKFLGVRIWRVR